MLAILTTAGFTAIALFALMALAASLAKGAAAAASLRQQLAGSPAHRALTVRHTVTSAAGVLPSALSVRQSRRMVAQAVRREQLPERVAA